MKRCLALALASALAGCAAVDPRARFAAVQQAVADRTHAQIRWNDGTGADRAAAQQVDALLAKPLDADAAVQVALLNNRHLQAIYEELGVAQADLVQAGLLRNPIFGGDVRLVEGNRSSPTIDLNIAVDFLDLLFIPLRKNLAAAELEAAETRVTSAVLDLAAQTREAFIDVQAAQQTVELMGQAEMATAASAELAKRLRDAGNNRPLDLASEDALHAESQLALARAQTDLAAKSERLTRLLGAANANWSIVVRLLDPTSETNEAANLERRAIDRSLDLRAARATIDVGRRELGITKPLGVLSDIELGANAERQDGQWEIGPSLSTPLPIFSQEQPAVARAQARLRQAEQRYAATTIDVRSSVRAAFLRTQSLRRQVAQFRTTLLPLRESIVNQTQLQFNAMQVGGFELLLAKREQIEAGRAYVELLRDFWKAQTELELILSGRMPDGMAERTN